MVVRESSKKIATTGISEAFEDRSAVVSPGFLAKKELKVGSFTRLDLENFTKFERRVT